MSASGLRAASENRVIDTTNTGMTVDRKTGISGGTFQRPSSCRENKQADDDDYGDYEIDGPSNFEEEEGVGGGRISSA